MADPLVIQVMRQHKQALFLREEAQMAEMALRWLDVERKLEAQIAALTQQIANEAITSQGKIYRLERYKQLLSQTRVELRGYEDYAEARIVQGQLDYGALGIRDASEAIQASYGDYGPWFNRLDVRATENMAGMLGNGKPLRGLLSEAYGDAAQGLTEALTRGTALGWNPRKTAKAMQDGMAHGLGRMMTIARTEQMRVYRESSRMQYEESGVVEGFVRLTAHDSRVCLGCLALEGEWFSTKDSLYDHPNGRCAAAPIASGAPPLVFERGEEWFGRQPGDMQRKMMGAETWQAWQRGEFAFADLGRQTPNATWGASVRPATLGELGIEAQAA